MNPAISDVSGLYDDGWSERIFQCSVNAEQPITACVFAVWLKHEPGRTQSTFEVSVNGAPGSHYSVRHDVTTVLHVPFGAHGGTNSTLRISCDNDVSDTGSDVRPLSFKLNSVRFE
jgi:hypothetical protein